MSKTLAFTGLRSQKLPFKFDEGHPDCLALKEKIRDVLINLIEKENVSYFISGLALGSDQICAGIVLELKEMYPAITLEAAIPCIGQDKLWLAKNRKIYKELIDKCDIVHMCSTESYTDGCMIVRNKYVVNKADIVFAITDGQRGGTFATINIAREHNKKVLILNPKNFELKEE